MQTGDFLLASIHTLDASHNTQLHSEVLSSVLSHPGTQQHCFCLLYPMRNILSNKFIIKILHSHALQTHEAVYFRETAVTHFPTAQNEYVVI